MLANYCLLKTKIGQKSGKIPIFLKYFSYSVENPYEKYILQEQRILLMEMDLRIYLQSHFQLPDVNACHVQGAIFFLRAPFQGGQNVSHPPSPVRIPPPREIEKTAPLVLWTTYPLYGLTVRSKCFLLFFNLFFLFYIFFRILQKIPTKYFSYSVENPYEKYITRIAYTINGDGCALLFGKAIFNSLT